jgi:branched-chain amino acid transport system substrate-binding protein
VKAVFAFGDGACTDKMKELAGEASEAMVCSQAGIPVQAASKAFLEAFKKKFNSDPLIYAPFTYDGANLLIAAMQAANSADPAKYLPELAKIKYDGASGHIEFDAKGDRKDAEMTIFTMKNGAITPVAVIKAGKSTKFEDFIKAAPAK